MRNFRSDDVDLLMSPEATKIRHREKTHRLLFYTLTSVLIAFSVWCLLLLVRAHAIHHDLHLHFSWLQEMRWVRGEIERLRTGEPAGNAVELRAADEEAAASGPWPELERFPRTSEELVERLDDPELLVPAQNLRSAFQQLHEEATAGADADAIWVASVSALHATDALEGLVQHHISALHDDLGKHWNSLNLLVLASLALCGSNLALLYLAHRRRLELEAAHSQALRQASHDPLTGLWNREAIIRQLGHELVRAQRSEGPLGVILVDIEQFKQVNVLLGQDQGDYILQQISSRLQSLVRPYDTLGRYGGDSFLVVLPSCGETATAGIAERLVDAVSEPEVEHAFGRIRVSVNLGRTTAQPAETDVNALLLRLHENLEEARKRQPGPPRRS
ncbi:MAG: GGDEF domain-containing protein [bacterium]|nr:GGDEF domain-containing protein [bacterium]